jgi:DNA-binding CsgD family transcriptional regulator
LTGGQAKIVRLLARGLGTHAAAAELGIAVNTLRAQLNTVYRRIGITHRGELILWALANGFGSDQQ